MFARTFLCPFYIIKCKSSVIRRTSCVLLLLAPVNVYAGQLGTALPWISGATAAGDLVLNNDDYIGEFADNPNKFKVNEEGPCCPVADMRQSIGDTERVIATLPSGGVTEYAMSLGGGYQRSSAGVSLDSVFLVQLGFGTGEQFVRAQELVPELRFDLPASVSPAIEDVFLAGPTPTLQLIGHETDTLAYLGRPASLGWFPVFSSPELFKFPLDIPDLPESVRDLYSAEALAELAPTDVPFTIRIGPGAIPELNGDFNGDGACDGADFLVWQRGDSPFPGTDLADWTANFGNISTAITATASIPEPSTLLVGALAAVGQLVTFRQSRK